MPTQVTITYGPGKQLQNESEARAWLLGVNPVADDKNYYIAVDNGAVLRLTPDTVLQNSDDTRRVTIGPAAGQSFKELNPGVYNVLANMTGPRVRIPRGQYTTPIGSGIDIKDLIYEVEAGGAGNGIVYNQRRDSSTIDNRIHRCRIIDLSANGASVFGFGFNNSKTEILDCTGIIEGGTGKNFFDNRGETKVRRCTFVARGTAANNAVVAVSEYVGASVEDTVFIGFGAKILDATINTVNCYSNTTPTVGRTAGITVVTAAGGLVVDEASNYCPSASSPLINAATASADKTDDNNGDYRGDVADIGAFQRTPQARPVASVATVNSVVVSGRKVTVNATFTGTANTGVISLALAATPNTVAASKAATISGNTATAIFDLTTPGSYDTPKVILTNETGPGTSTGTQPFTVTAPPVPTAVITSVTKSGRNVTISGTYTGIYPNEPISGTVTLTAGSGGATTKTAPATLLPNGTFSGFVASNTYGEYSQTSVAIVNYSGTGSDTDMGVSIPSPALAVGEVLAPITFENTSASTQTNMPVTFGHPFVFGEFPATGAAVLLRAPDNSTIPAQIDVRNTNEDGSVRHAVISAIIPSLAASESKTYSIVRATAAASTPAVVSEFTGLDSVVTLTQGGTVYTLSVATLLAGTKTNWLSGDVVSEWEVAGIPKTSGNVEHPHIHVRAHVRGYKGQNKARIDLSIENTWAWNASPQDVTYDLAITVGGNALYSKTGLVHYPRARHRHIGWWNAAAPTVHIKHDIAYLPKSRATPNYDTATTPSLTKANSIYNATVTNSNPMGYGCAEAGMQAVGGRYDIGILPGWAALYLISMFKPAKEGVLNQGNLAGSWGMHFRDKNTGRVLSLQDWPHFATIGTSGDNVNPATGQSELAPYAVSNTNPCVADVSHHPDQAYVPYLVTGDIYYAEELQFWMLNCVISQNSHPNYRNGAAGLVKGEQTRGQAWSLRTMAHAAYILPPSLGQAEAVRLLKSNIDWYDANYTNVPSAKLGALVLGEYTVGYSTDETKGAKTGVAPWQDDFFTATIGRALELGMEYVRPLFNWKAKFVTARLYGSPGTHWQQAAAARLRVRDTDISPIYDTYLQCYQGTFSPDILAAAASAPAATQEMATAWNNYNAWALANSYSGMDGVADVAIGDMDGYSSSPSGYPSNLQQAIAYCASHGAPNAGPAWTQFMARSIKPDYGTEPQFSMVPYTITVEEPVEPPAPTAPLKPTSVTATAGNGTVSVTGTVNNGGSAITSYYVIASTGQSASSATQPVSLNMPNGVAATFRLRADNVVGQGTLSDPSNSVTPSAVATAPGAPTIGTAVAGDGFVDVFFTAPSSNGGAAITSYRATLSTGEFANGATSPIRVTASNGVARTATVTATNSVGTGPASAASNSVTPTATVVVPPPQRSVSLTMLNAASLSGLKWSWFDQPVPNNFAAPTDKGAIESTDANGVIVIALPNSQLSIGGVGWLIVTDSDGNPATAHSAFSGPRVVA